VTVEVRIYSRVTVADVEEDDTNQQTQKERKEKTGCQSDSVTNQVPALADTQQLDLRHQARGRDFHHGGTSHILVFSHNPGFAQYAFVSRKESSFI
jgi:hypothetical protein